ncbi:MAG: LamG domain-containing protein [Symploca sp. SIO2B6]|nr:LamG domain-containing protein [Symploca sp. SIO2B6]
MKKTNSELEKLFLKTYSNQVYQYTTMVRHNGTMIAFAMGENHRIYYSLLNLDGQNEQTIDAKNWSATPIELRFPNELAQVGFGVIAPKTLPLVKFGGEEVGIDEQVRLEEIDPFLSSTARFTADAPFQVLSDQKYVYVFRQAIGAEDKNALFVSVQSEDNQSIDIPVVNETLLVDRFVFVENQLRMSLDVRFRRSRNKFRPLNSKDTLGAKDMDEMPFFEPTQELDFIRNLQGGHFSVLQLPTQIADIKRWQIFAHNSQTDRIDSFNIERSQDGWFNIRGSALTANSGSNFSESALQLDGVDDYINLEEFSPGENFTIEMWVNPRDKSEEAPPEVIPNQMLLSKTNSEGEDIFSFGYYADFLGLNFRGKQLPTTAAQQENVSQAIADWHHLAITVEHHHADNISQITTYHNGVKAWSEELPDMVMGDISGYGWQLGRKFNGKKGSDYFDGSFDEVRIWNRRLSEEEIQANFNHRLVGNELGLLIYYRFDEGIGINLYDQTDNAIDATIGGMNPGLETWIASAAPLGESRGISRTSFGFKHRTIESGLSALLYFQQEDVITGNDSTPKPTKQDARVMLAVATKSEDDQHNHIAVLDFALTKNGKLAQILDNIPLEKIKEQLPANLLEIFPEGVEGEDVNLINVTTNLERETIPRLESELAKLLTEHQTVKEKIRANERETKNRQRRQVQLERQQANSTVGATFYSGLKFQGESFRFTQGYNGGVNGLSIGRGSLEIDSGVRVTLYAPGGIIHPYTESRKRLWGTSSSPPPYNRIVVNLQALVNELNQVNHRLNQLAAQLRELEAQRLSLEVQIMSKGTELEMKRGQLGEIRKLLMNEKSLPMPLIHLDPMGMSVFGGLLEFAETKDNPQLFESATGKIALYFRGMEDEFLATYYNTHTSRGQLQLNPQLLLIARAPGTQLGSIRITISDGSGADTCTVQLQSVPSMGVAVRISELEEEKAELFLQREQLNERISQRSVELFTGSFFQSESLSLTTGYQGAIDTQFIGKIQSIRLEQGVKVMLYEGEEFTGTAIPYLQSQRHLGETSVPVPTYRSVKVELTADAMTEKAMVIERQIAQIYAELNRLQLRITEIWADVPRNGEQFALILNGQATEEEYNYTDNVESNRAAYNIQHGSFFVKVINSVPNGIVKNTQANGEQLQNSDSSLSWIADPLP